MDFESEMKAALETYVLECRELLASMEEILLNLEHGRPGAEEINAIFRAAHTIKGSSGLFGLDHLVHFTHKIESLLDSLRAGELSLSSALVEVLLKCCDHISAQVEGVAAGIMHDSDEMAEAGLYLHQQLDVLMNQAAVSQASQTGDLAHAEAPQPDSGVASKLEGGNWYLSIRFGRDCLRNGMDPLSFIRYLSTMGDIVRIITLTNELPELQQLDPESSYLGFELVFKSEASKQDIESVFEFVQDDSTIRIVPPNSKIDQYIDIINSLPDEHDKLGDILIESGVLTRHELDVCLGLQASQPEFGNTAGERTPIGEILLDQEMLHAPLLNAALQKQQQIKDSRNRERQSIRVDAERLDKLIDLIGELVIAGAGANLRAAGSHADSLQEATGEVMRLVEQVRDSALQLRMVPVGSTFSRFQRVVRDVSAELGKQITLEISGGDTEVDKSVVEKIGDPLMHLVRNAIDHGIEPAELRRLHGKPAQGVLRMNAYHESGSIVIEVSDDGGGLNKEKILSKALERGLISSGQNLSDKEIFALIFEPGFSTADQVSNLSGRGVGMDVVKKNVNSLRGSIDIDSSPGLGTTMRIRLPLTLAIIDGFLVAVGASSFVMPLDHVIECVELPQNALQLGYMDLRGQVLPLIHLRHLFEIPQQQLTRQNVVVVGYGNVRAGLVVDRLMGEFQTVIKPLGKVFQHVRGIGGSTILGSGEVALILSIPALIQHYADLNKRNQTVPARLEASPGPPPRLH